MNIQNHIFRKVLFDNVIMPKLLILCYKRIEECVVKI